MKHLYREMTWPEVNEAVRQRRVMLVPVAAIEQHGPHLPIDTDNLSASYIAEEAAKRAPGVLLSAPAIHYGFNEHNMDFPGTVSVQMDTLLKFAFEVGQSFARQGFTRIIWLNGHGSNSPIYNLVARKLTNESTALSASIDWWSLAWDTIKRVCEGFPESVDHACEWETSVYQFLKPQLVQEDKLHDEVASEKGGPRWLYPNLGGNAAVHFMARWSRMTTTGVNGRPSLATARKGEEMLEDAITKLIQIAGEFRDLSMAPWQDYKEAPTRPHDD